MPLNFEKNAQKGNKFLNELAAEFGDPMDTNRAGRMLRCVFHVLRDHLTLEESFQLLSQLPLALKALYVDSWTPQRHRMKSRTITDFFNEMIREDGYSSLKDFSTGADVLDAVHLVFKTLRRHISEGEFRNMEAVLPKDIKILLQNEYDSKDVFTEITAES